MENFIKKQTKHLTYAIRLSESDMKKLRELKEEGYDIPENFRNLIKEMHDKLIEDPDERVMML